MYLFRIMPKVIVQPVVGGTTHATFAYAIKYVDELCRGGQKSQGNWTGQEGGGGAKRRLWRHKRDTG